MSDERLILVCGSRKYDDRGQVREAAGHSPGEGS